MGSRNRKVKRGEAHVRLYAHELRSEAYRTMSPDARALLIEMRAMYDGRKNLFYMSVRQMMERLGIGQRRAQTARDELIDRGWVRVVVLGSFNRKAKHATQYVLTNEPLDDRDGATAPKDYMRWRPSEKNTVAEMTTDGSQIDYRGHEKGAEKPLHGSQIDYRKRSFRRFSVVNSATQIELPREYSQRNPFLWAVTLPGIGKTAQRKLIVAWLLTRSQAMRAAA